MKKLFLIFSFIFIFLGLPFLGKAQEKVINVYFFYGDGCPHCASEELFLDKLEKEYKDKIKIYRYEAWYDQDNVKLLKKFADAHNASVTGVPVTFVGQRAIIGYDNESNRGAEIKQALEYCLATGCQCPGDDILGLNQNNDQSEEAECKDEKAMSTIVNLPFLGEKDLASYSLPVLSVVLGAIDGFNPCAMWVLMFLITLLIGMKPASRRWLLGLVFIIASGAVYFLFMSAWLNFLMFLGYVQWIRILIGIFGIVSGFLFFRDYWKNKEGTCKVVNTDKRRKIFDRLKDIVKNPNLALAILGIVLLAFTVNLVELACSLGFPAIFTQLLALANLPSWQYYGYILIYIIFFIIDDLIIFIIAMTTLHITGLNTKYSRYSSLIGGILILLIGFILILKPEWLMFG